MWAAVCAYTVCTGFKQTIARSRFVVSVDSLRAECCRNRWSLTAEIPSIGKAEVHSWAVLFSPMLGRFTEVSGPALKMVISSPATIALEPVAGSGVKETGPGRAALALSLRRSARSTGRTRQGYDAPLPRLLFLAHAVLALLTSS